MEEKIDYAGWPNCVRLCNGEVELIMTTDVGPRIIRFGFVDKQNFFYLSPEDSGKTGGEDWRIYGGHRLWLAPEVIPFTYYPDNEAVGYKYDDQILKLTQARETRSGIVKEIEISLSMTQNQVTVLHRLINQNHTDIELAPWALSVMAPGGRAILPQEPYGVGDDYLLPARSLALWHYTKMNDPRWTWGEKYIQAIQDPSIRSEQKIGIMNKQGWSAYYLNGELFIKQFSFDPATVYPDYGCNNEIYINGNFLEIESLGPLIKIQPGALIEHTECWSLCKVVADKSEQSIDKNILPFVHAFKK